MFGLGNIPADPGGYEDRLSAIGGVPSPFIWPKGGTWRPSTRAIPTGKESSFARFLMERSLEEPVDSSLRLTTPLVDDDPAERDWYDPLRADSSLLLSELGDLGGSVRVVGIKWDEGLIEQASSFTTRNGPLRLREPGESLLRPEKLPNLLEIFMAAEQVSIALAAFKAIGSGTDEDKVDFIDGYATWLERLNTPIWTTEAEEWRQLLSESSSSHFLDRVKPWLSATISGHLQSENVVLQIEHRWARPSSATPEGWIFNYKPQSLLGAAWVQFALNLQSGSAIRRCKRDECRLLFFARRATSRAEYCPYPRPPRRSTCSQLAAAKRQSKGNKNE